MTKENYGSWTNTGEAAEVKSDEQKQMEEGARQTERPLGDSELDAIIDQAEGKSALKQAVESGDFDAALDQLEQK